MPVRVPVSLPAVETLREENIFVIDEQRASSQDIRPLRIAILNLMPLKVMTETDLLRLISNTPLQIELDFIDTDSHVSKNTPREHIETFYKKFEKEYGVEIGILAGYGLLQGPITESSDDTGDCTVDLKSASFGATAAGVFDTLSDEYIAERTALGYGDYISADRKVDASTCLFPDTTWIIKNKHHDTMTGYYIVEKFCQYENFTVSNNYKDIDRFLVASLEKYGNNTFENMTEDNCGDPYWITDVEQTPTLKTKIEALISFLKVFFKVITELFNGNITLDF